jgi:hypothetical protein
MSHHRHDDSSSDDQSEVQEAKQEAAENVVERVESWQDGAEQETVREELAEGMERAGVEVDDAQLDETAKQIHARGKADGTPEAH